MKQFLTEEIIRFLQSTNNHLAVPCQLIVIGGAAASLAYGASKTTTDIDLATEIPADLSAALESARAETGIWIPVSYVGLFDPPYEYERRLTTVDHLGLSKLQLFVPERHDLALMKIVRGYENDIQAIEEIHQHFPLDYETLIERFMNEMTQAIGDPGTIRLNFLMMVEIIFDSKHAEEADQKTEGWGKASI